MLSRIRPGRTQAQARPLPAMMKLVILSENGLLPEP